MKVPTFHRTIPGIAAVLTYALLFTQFAGAAQSSSSQQNPLPIERQAPADASQSEPAAQARLLAAKNIYIADDGADDHFPGSSDEALHAFAASLRAWGRYHIVSSAAQADVVLQLRSGVNRSYVPSSDADSYNYGTYVYHPYFRMTIADPATLDPLWVITVPVLTGHRKGDKADLFNVSASTLTTQLKLLTDTPLTAQETADLKEPAIRRHKRHVLMVGIIAGTVAVAAGSALLLHHEYENSLASQKQQQDAFCTANHIPLSECAGG